MLRITLVLFIVGEATARVDFLRPCPAVAPIKNLIVRDYIGKWYEAAKYIAWSKVRKKCVTANYLLQDDGSIMMKDAEVTDNNQSASVTGIARPSGNTADAKWTIKFLSGWVDSADYWVLGTNYKEWEVVWSCTYDGNTSTRNAKILTRDRFPKPWVLDAAYGVVDKNKIDRTDFRKTEQTRCPHAY